MRILSHPLFGTVDFRQLHQPVYPLLNLFLRHPALMRFYRLPDLRPDGSGRLQRRHRILKHDGKYLSSQTTHFLLRLI